MLYQKVSLSTTDPIDSPDSLPFAIANWPAELVADLSELNPIYGLNDVGFWPVVDDIPEYNPSTETIVQGDLTKDSLNKCFIREWTIELLPVPDPTPELVASGVFTVTDGIVESIDVAVGIAVVFPIDIGTYWLFFNESQSNLSYGAYVSSSTGQINVTSRNLDYMELCVNDGGTLIDPAEFSVNIVRSL